MDFPTIGDEGLRLVANMETHYDTWRQARRQVKDGRLQWKTSGDAMYLYRMIDSRGNGTSLGVRSAKTEALMEAYLTARQTIDGTWAQLVKEGRMYRALRLPRIASYAGQVLREMDVEGLLGDAVLVVGTNAMSVYAIEAGRLLGSELDATEDFDLTYLGQLRADILAPPSIFGVLKQVDPTYTINSERTFQARNSRGNEVELLMAASLDGQMSRYEKLRPVPLPEQDWLLPGVRISHVVCGMDSLPARVVAPDPRWFALHKLWLADKPGRDPLKRPKDRAQGEATLHLVADHMPHLPIDDEFQNALPPELVPYLERWRDEHHPSAAHP